MLNDRNLKLNLFNYREGLRRTIHLFKNSLSQKLKELSSAGGLISLLLILTVFLYLLRTGTGHSAFNNKRTLYYSIPEPIINE